MLGEEQLWGDTKVREQKLASGVQTPRRRVGSDSVQTCKAPGSALRVYHPQTALRLHLETVSLSHVATYVNVTQDAPTQERMWGAPRFSSCRNAGAPLGIQWLHDTLGRHLRSCSTLCSLLGPHRHHCPALCGGLTGHHLRKTRMGRGVRDCCPKLHMSPRALAQPVPHMKCM